MSYTNSNPNLLDPTSLTSDRVSPLAGMTKPLPVRLLPEDQTAYFVCTMLNHHMHRTDGKRLAFVFGTLATRDLYDIQYINDEISAGNPFVREATSQEIRSYSMRVDPKGTLAKEITPEIEQRVRTELEVSLRSSWEKQLNSIGVTLTAEQLETMKQMAHTQVEEQAAQEESKDPGKIASLDALSRLRANFEGGIKTGTGTLLMGQGLQQSSIGGSDKTVNFAPGIDDTKGPV